MNTSVEAVDKRIEESLVTKATLSKLTKTIVATSKTLPTVEKKYDKLAMKLRPQKANDKVDIKKILPRPILLR